MLPSTLRATAHSIQQVTGAQEIHGLEANDIVIESVSNIFIIFIKKEVVIVVVIIIIITTIVIIICIRVHVTVTTAADAIIVIIEVYFVVSVYTVVVSADIIHVIPSPEHWVFFYF